jgi:hypothetical protein
MNPGLFGLVAAVALTAVFGCTIGAPERASDTQNLNAISDDISAIGMTRSDVMRTDDPMRRTVYPFHDQLPEE